ncbi:30S ribosomal protein S20 [bioreactor metagenome]|uniref:30S ribosomal protein S20 n=1 Tax=bioreactor metagenome TaxID=1076179 RepID=A0A644ZIB3_9ZZZZ
MANNKSAIKRVKITAKKTARNNIIRSKVRNSIRKFKVAVTNHTETSEATLQYAISQIDKAVSKGILHKNNAARKKSRLTKRLNKAAV